MKEPSVKKVETVATMRAEAKPDLYAGKTCDQLRPRWYTRCQGEEGEYHDDDIVLDPKQFPPGTKVTIAEPLCPTCGETRGQKFPFQSPPVFDAKCECGFDWEVWVANQYS